MTARAAGGVGAYVADEVDGRFDDDGAYLDYAVRWRAGHSASGRHQSRFAGLGGHFRAFRPFWQSPDAARIDVRRSITDPFGEIMVRQTDHRAAIPVILAADVSRSMNAAEGAHNMESVRRLAAALARSAQRAGDRFGLIAFDAGLRTDLCLAPTASRGAAAAAVARLAGVLPHGRGSGGIAELAASLPAQSRSLIVLASDFQMPPETVAAALERLAKHDVAPVVFHEARERELPPAGLLRMADAETGARRLVWLRPAVRARWVRARAERRAALENVFARFGRPGFHVEGGLDLARLGEHLLTVQ